MALLPPPCDLGLPASFRTWRTGQPEAILHAIDGPQRHQALVLPTGFGKSLVYMAISVLTGAQTVILTSTKALQRQLRREFGAAEAEGAPGAPTVAVVQGQRAYTCLALEPGGALALAFGTGDERRPTTVDHAPCHLGVDCALKAGGCSYFDALRAAQTASIVITNYAWWLTTAFKPGAQLRPTLLVLDEAHAAPDALADALGGSVSTELVGSVLSERLGKWDDRTPAQWSEWARARVTTLNARMEGVQPRNRSAIVAIRKAQTLLYALDRVRQIDPRLLLVSPELDGVRFDTVWAAPYSEQWLFRHVPRIVLTSATMTAKTADLLGIPEKHVALYEAGDGFPLHRRPVYVAPAKKGHFGEPLRIDHRMTQDDERSWLAHVDAIIGARPDRKGIVHTISYRRRDIIIARSAHRERMLTHGPHDAQQQIAAFKRAPAGTVLVSPSVTTGYDFPYRECEYQIVAKVPFPDSRDPVTAARTLVDKRYPAHLAMQQLVQMVGRGMRAPDDRCETFLVDAHGQWFLSKHADLSPRWFRRAVKRLDPGTLPAPPPSLEPGSFTVGDAGSTLTEETDA